MNLTASVGMMDQHYFASRSELLHWLNSYFSLNLSKIEECCTGAVYCQIADAVYYYQVPMKSVHWGAKKDFEYVKNYKVLQQLFTKVNQPRMIDVQKLIRGKYQDNLEFLQWMKALFDTSGAIDREYDAMGRRRLGKGPFLNWSMAGTEKERVALMNKSDYTFTKTRSSIRNINSEISNSFIKGVNKSATRSTIEHGISGTASDISRLKKEITNLNTEITNERAERQIAEQERNFYFNKLRAIEIICQQENRVEVDVKEALNILYAVDDIDIESIATKYSVAYDGKKINEENVNSDEKEKIVD